MTDEHYQDGIKLPMRGDNDSRDNLKHHLEACRLLGEAHGFLFGMMNDFKFESKEHHDSVKTAIYRWADRMNKFVELRA